MAKLSKHLDMQNVSHNVDRLSGLPDPLLHHILSFLTTKIVAQTCLLSKKWKDFWCSVPHLNFELRSHQSNTLRLSKFVESVLIHRDGSNLQSFRLRTSWDWPKDKDEDFDAESVDRYRMSSWIIFALRHNFHGLSVFVWLTLVIFLWYKEYGLHLHKWSQTPINSLKFLKLNILFSKNHVQVVTLLRSCPNIETIVLKNIESEDQEDESEEKVELKKELSHLKFVKFYNFRGSKNEVQLIELFFNKATNMEKLIVMAPELINDSETKKLLAKIPKILLKNPRATRICIDASNASVSCVLVFK